MTEERKNFLFIRLMRIYDYFLLFVYCCHLTNKVTYKKAKTKVKEGKGRALDIAPQVTNLRGAQVHGVHKAASHIPALYLPSYSWYSFTDPERMEG